MGTAIYRGGESGRSIALEFEKKRYWGSGHFYSAPGIFILSGIFNLSSLFWTRRKNIRDLPFTEQFCEVALYILHYENLPIYIDFFSC